jgi:DNA-binding response OmpR family regulator
MDYMNVEPSIESDEALFDAAPGASWTKLPARPRAERAAGAMLRYRGLALDLATGAVRLQERQVRLGVAERDLLKVLMRRAGQIIDSSRLAEQLGVTIAEIDEHAHTLSTTLADAGAQCLPRQVEGLGYILWR